MAPLESEADDVSSSFQVTSTIRYDPELPQLRLAPTYPQPQRSPYYLLRYHHDRLLAAASDMQWASAIARLRRDEPPSSPEATKVGDLATVLDEHVPDRTKPWRLQVLLDRDGQFTGEASATPTLPRLQAQLQPVGFESLVAAGRSSSGDGEKIPRWTLRLDSQATQPSAFTRHKTTQREMYAAARERVGIRSLSETVEALVYSPQGEVMEGSITTVYFRASRAQSRRPTAHRPGSEGGSASWVTPPLSSGGNAGTTRRYALAMELCTEAVVRVDELVDGEEVVLSNGLRGFMPAVLQLGPDPSSRP